MNKTTTERGYKVQIFFKGEWCFIGGGEFLTAQEAEVERGYCEMHGDVVRIVHASSL